MQNVINYYVYTDWIVDFQSNLNCRSLVTSYLESQLIKEQEEEKGFFHLLQFLSFVKSLKLNPFKDCKKYRLKEPQFQPNSLYQL